MSIADIATALKQVFVEAIETGAGRPFAETGVTMPMDEIWERYARAANGAAKHLITASQLAVFKSAFYSNSGDDTDDPFEKAFEAIGWSLVPEPPTGIAREVLGVKVAFIADCLRNYAAALRSGEMDVAGHYFPADIEEAADMIEAADIELLDAAKAVVGAFVQTREHTHAMWRLREIVEKRG